MVFASVQDTRQPSSPLVEKLDLNREEPDKEAELSIEFTIAQAAYVVMAGPSLAEISLMRKTVIGLKKLFARWLWVSCGQVLLHI